MSGDVEFCLLAERENLGGQAVLVCESPRAFARGYAASKITVLSPRESRLASSQTTARFSRFGANYVELDPASAVPEYGSSRKSAGW